MSRIVLVLLFGTILLHSSGWSYGSESEGKPIVVTGIEGKGKDEQSALENAYREAIRKALGDYTLWCAETDGETYDEKIYANADAVVSAHRVVGREERDEKVFLTIDAEIIPNEMMKYIQRIPSVEVGEGELANLVNKRKAIEAAVKSLDLLCINWQQNLFSLEKYGSFTIAPGDDLEGKTMEVSVPFIWTFNWPNYRIWRKKVMLLLDRIAIAKTSGRCKDFAAFEQFYENTTFFRDHDALEDNPNKYRAVLFLDEWPKPTVNYTLYLVPYQILKKLANLLNAEIDIRFVITGSGKSEVARFSFPAEVTFAEGLWHVNSWDTYKFSDFSAHKGGVVFRDKVHTYTYNKSSGWGYRCSTQCLFHATIPIPADVVSRVKECKICCMPRTEKSSRNNSCGISIAALPQAAWLSIEPNPGFYAERDSISDAERDTIPGTDKGRETPATAPMSRPQTFGFISGLESIGAALEELQQVQTAANLSKMEAAWKALPSGQQKLLQKNVMWVSCGILLGHEQNAAVAKRSAMLDTKALVKAVSDECPTCDGSGYSERPCRKCGGSGRCLFSGCNGSGRIQRMMGGASPCPNCHGSGRCPVCCGSGHDREKCPRCNGMGRILSESKCQETVEENIEEALRICRGEE